MQQALLVLEDGTQWRGVALGAQGTRAAEVVFNTPLRVIKKSSPTRHIMDKSSS